MNRIFSAWITILLYLYTIVNALVIPYYGKTATVSVAKIADAGFPALKLTVMGGRIPGLVFRQQIRALVTGVEPLQV